MILQTIFRPAAIAAALLFGMAVVTWADGMAGETPSTGEPKPQIIDSQSVESADYQVYLHNLQALGFPKQTIDSIVTSDVIAAFAGKRAGAVAARYQNFTYWHADPSDTEARAKLAAQRSVIDEEMNGVLQQLLGTGANLPDVSREWQRAEWNQELAFLAPNKREACEVTLAEYTKANLQMKELASGMNVTEDTNALQQILARYQEERSTLQNLLAPDEYRRVEMTTSWTAENLRHAMVHFEPTEQEFRIIFEAWQPHDENLSYIHAMRLPDPGHKEEEVYAKIKAQLSESRYDEYRATWWK